MARRRNSATTSKTFTDRANWWYRRTPVMQIGADIYCDSQCIIRELERRYCAPPLMPSADSGLNGNHYEVFNFNPSISGNYKIEYRRLSNADTDMKTDAAWSLSAQF